MRNLLIGICLGALAVSAVAAGPALMTQAIVPATIGADEPNTNAEAIAFSNQRIRVAADKLAQAYTFAKLVSAEWTANNMGELFPSGSVVVDGSETDGRHPVTGNDVTLVIIRLQELVADYEANSNAKLNTVLNVAVNPIP